MENHSFDRNEIKMLEILQREGRKPLSELAAAIGLSATPATRRFETLRQAGVIAGFSARLDRHAVGLAVEVFVQVRLDTHADNSPEVFIEHIRTLEAVIACWALTGDHDFLLQVVLPDVSALNAFVGGRLLRIPVIRDVRTNLVLDNIKGPDPLPLSHLSASG